MHRDEEHEKIRDIVKNFIDSGLTLDEIAGLLGLEVGTRYKRGTVTWYKYCLIAKENQKKAFEKHGSALYSNAGKVAQKKHPWIGHELGKKYGSFCGRKKVEQVRASGNSKEYYVALARKLQEKDPCHSRRNMKKAHQTMKSEGTFFKHQKEATLKCMQKHPDQLKRMSKIAHEKYPDLAYRSRKKRWENSPYSYLNCKFDSNQERKVCKLLVKEGLIEKPVEGKNVQFRIKNYQIDFFLFEKVFLEFHPSIKLKGKNETEESYFDKRRKILDENGFRNYPLFVIPKIELAEKIILGIKTIFSEEQS
jgi:hypothetical protein